mgnify:CR=1 FL=1
MSLLEVKVPDIGDFKDVPVIGIEVSPGDTVKAEDPLVTLESDKATMEVPSPAAGVVKEIKLKIGDKVAEGTLVLLLETSETAPSPQPSPASGRGSEASPSPPRGEGRGERAAAPAEPPAPPPPPSAPPPAPAQIAAAVEGGHRAHASPSVRRFARELGVDVAPHEARLWAVQLRSRTRPHHANQFDAHPAASRR